MNTTCWVIHCYLGNRSCLPVFNLQILCIKLLSTPLFKKGGLESVHQPQGARTPQPPQLCAWDTGEESLSVSQASDSGRFSVVEAGPTLHPLQNIRESWEVAQPLNTCFVHLENAFNCVPRGIPWGVLQRYEVSGL